MVNLTDMQAHPQKIPLRDYSLVIADAIVKLLTVITLVHKLLEFKKSFNCRSTCTLMSTCQYDDCYSV